MSAFERGWDNGHAFGQRQGTEQALHDAMVALIQGGQLESEAYRIIEGLYEAATVAHATEA